MHSMRGPAIAFYVLVAIVLFYLIARPHIGTVWYLKGGLLPHGLTLEQVRALPSGFTPDSPAPLAPLPTTRFVDKRDCLDAEARLENAGNTGVYCVSENGLLWGW
jgi:hypothetical protein